MLLFLVNKDGACLDPEGQPSETGRELAAIFVSSAIFSVCLYFSCPLAASASRNNASNIFLFQQFILLTLVWLYILQYKSFIPVDFIFLIQLIYSIFLMFMKKKAPSALLPSSFQEL